MDFSPRTLRIRFHELARQIKAIEETTAPIRARRDELVQSVMPQVRALEAEYLEKEEGLFDMKQELATIARALKGQTGKDPLEEEAAGAASVSTAAGTEPDEAA